MVFKLEKDALVLRSFHSEHTSHEAVQQPIAHDLFKDSLLITMRRCRAFRMIVCSRLLHGLMACMFGMKTPKHQGVLFQLKDHFGLARWTTTRIKAIA